MGDLSRDEFLAHVGYIREDVAGVNARLDTLNGRTRKLENAVFILQHHHQHRHREGRKKTGLIGGIGLFIGGIFVAIYQYFSGGK